MGKFNLQLRSYQIINKFNLQLRSYQITNKFNLQLRPYQIINKFNLQLRSYQIMNKFNSILLPRHASMGAPILCLTLKTICSSASNFVKAYLMTSSLRSHLSYMTLGLFDFQHSW